VQINEKKIRRNKISAKPEHEMKKMKTKEK
jgi:hypothetical protein